MNADLLIPVSKPDIMENPSLSVTAVARQAQIAKLFKYMTENQVSWTAACRDLGFDRGTMKRWLAKSENKELLARFREMELQAAVQVCSAGLVQIAEGQVEIATDPAQDPKSRTSAAKWVQQFLETHGRLDQSGQEDTPQIAKFKATFNLTGPSTFVVERPDTPARP